MEKREESAIRRRARNLLAWSCRFYDVDVDEKTDQELEIMLSQHAHDWWCGVMFYRVMLAQRWAEKIPELADERRPFGVGEPLWILANVGDREDVGAELYAACQVYRYDFDPFAPENHARALERWEDELEGGVGRSVVCYLLEHDLAESVRPGYLALSDAGWCRYLEVTDPL